MNKILYVGNLDYDVTPRDLMNLFSQHGEILETSVIMNNTTGKSKGFGFVTFADETKASEAIEKLNGLEFQGKNIVVKEANSNQQ